LGFANSEAGNRSAGCQPAFLSGVALRWQIGWSAERRENLWLWRDFDERRTKTPAGSLRYARFSAT
jgi:hypothetical protein